MTNSVQDKLAVLIMAAGKGTRMKSDLPKVLHRLRGEPLVKYVVETAQAIGGDPVVLIVGHKKELVMIEMQDYAVQFAVQEPQLGTGHAVQVALPVLEEFSGSALVLSGDVPLITEETLSKLMEVHIQERAACTVLTARTDNPHGYGRMVRNEKGYVDAIIEERDAPEEIKKIDEINSGIYIFELNELRRILPLIKADNDQEEYYLTDAVRLLTQEGKLVAALEGSYSEIMGINTVEQLKEAERSNT